jgi:micrococcal nuclease
MARSFSRVAFGLALGIGMLAPGFAAAPASAQSCDPSYPDFCIQPPWEVGDLDCYQVPYGGFTVYQPDPHYFDGDYDGIGCEW